MQDIHDLAFITGSQRLAIYNPQCKYPVQDCNLARKTLRSARSP